MVSVFAQTQPTDVWSGSVLYLVLTPVVLDVDTTLMPDVPGLAVRVVQPMPQSSRTLVRMWTAHWLSPGTYTVRFTLANGAPCRFAVAVRQPRPWINARGIGANLLADALVACQARRGEHQMSVEL